MEDIVDPLNLQQLMIVSIPPPIYSRFCAASQLFWQLLDLREWSEMVVIWGAYEPDQIPTLDEGMDELPEKRERERYERWLIPYFYSLKPSHF